MALVFEEMITGDAEGVDGTSFQVGGSHLTSHKYLAIHTAPKGETKWTALYMLFPGTRDEWVVVSGHIKPKHSEFFTAPIRHL